MDFANRLKILRKENNINQEQLASYINKSRSTIAGYEVRDRLPDLNTIIDIAKTFDISTDWLLGLTEDKSKLSEYTTDYCNGVKFLFENIAEQLIRNGIIININELTTDILEIVIKHGINSAIEILKLKK